MGDMTIIIRNDLEPLKEKEYLVTLVGVGTGKMKGEEWTLEDIVTKLEETLENRKKEEQERKEEEERKEEARYIKIIFNVPESEK